MSSMFFFFFGSLFSFCLLRYGAGCYRLGNADHCLKYSHPGVNEMNREREQVEHNLVNQISKDWDRGKEPGHIVKKVKPAPKKRQVDDEQVHVLAFPSISTATFEFDLEKAMSVLVDEVLQKKLAKVSFDRSV